jgi:uncharacterized protein (DUF1810 family)
MNNHIIDQYNLHRFVQAQTPVYDAVCAELRGGLKVTHWMWFVFPQLMGLSSSTTSKRFAITCLAEAEEYLKHPILDPRLRQCTELVTQISGRSIKRILGLIDSLKFQSSMTLFSHATKDNQIFDAALQKFYDGQYDELTLKLL